MRLLAKICPAVRNHERVLKLHNFSWFSSHPDSRCSRWEIFACRLNSFPIHSPPSHVLHVVSNAAPCSSVAPQLSVAAAPSMLQLWLWQSSESERKWKCESCFAYRIKFPCSSALPQLLLPSCNNKYLRPANVVNNWEKVKACVNKWKWKWIQV